MRLLIIGGSVFLGRHLASQAMAAGHLVTTLNRGTHNLTEQCNVERLIADRETTLDVLRGRSFDAVIDTCGYHPQIVRHSVKALKGSVGTYAFISSVSVYGEFSSIGITEQDQIRYTPPGEEGDYGTLKADCEKVLGELIPDHMLIVRPGLIVGPYDPTDRFTYWPARIASGGKILAPGRSDRAIQFIDVRDLSAWILMLVEKEVCGIYNATGPQQRLTMGTFLEACMQTTNSLCEFKWVDDQTLVGAGVKPWTELPLWIPESNSAFNGFMKLDCRRAYGAGLTLRTLTQTIADTLAWDQTRDIADTRKAGMKFGCEKELLSQLQRVAGLS